MQIRPTLQIHFNVAPLTLYDPVPEISYTYNPIFLRYRDWLVSAASKVEEMQVHNDAAALNLQVRLLESIQREREVLQLLLEQAWRKEVVVALAPPGVSHPITLVAGTNPTLFDLTHF